VPIITEKVVAITFSKVTRMTLAGDQLLNLLEIALDPLALVLSLWIVALAIQGVLLPAEVILALLVFALTFPGAMRLTQSPWSAAMLIEGHVLRHKVKPGITGWTQVNGYRGETETLDKMKARIDYDLDYLRNSSLRLDLYIVARTAWIVLKGNDATLKAVGSLRRTLHTLYRAGAAT